MSTRGVLGCLLAALVLATSGFAQDAELGRFLERRRADRAKFDALLARALRVGDVTLDELEPWLENDAFELRGRAVEVLDHLDTERERSLFAGRLEELFREERELAALDAALLPKYADDREAALDAERFLDERAAGAARLRRELARVAWRRGDMRSRVALLALVHSDPTDTFSARAHLDVGGSHGLESLVTVLANLDPRVEQRASKEFDQAQAALTKRAAAANDAAGLDERESSRARWALRDWIQRRRMRLDARAAAPVELTALVVELAERHDLPRAPKPTANAGTWTRWIAKATRDWPADVEPGRVVFRSKEAFTDKLAGIEQRLDEVSSEAELLSVIDELDAGFGAQRASRKVTELLARASLPRQLRSTRIQTPGEHVPIEVRARALHRLAFEAHEPTLLAALDDWGSRTLRGLPTEAGETDDPIPTELGSKPSIDARFDAFRAALGPELAALPAPASRVVLRDLLQLELSKPNALRLLQLVEWGTALLTGLGTGPEDWHAAIETFAERERALSVEPPLGPILALELDARFEAATRHWLGFASARALAPPPGDTLASAAWLAWIHSVAPLR